MLILLCMHCMDEPPRVTLSTIKYVLGPGASSYFHIEFRALA